MLEKCYKYNKNLSPFTRTHLASYLTSIETIKLRLGKIFPMAHKFVKYVIKNL
jgi:hypothetical protein